MKRLLSISLLILPLLALVSPRSLSAQTLVVDKPTLTFSGQFGGAVVSQTVNVTSSTGATIPFALIVPQANTWLKVGGQTIISGNTPAAVTITADPTGLAAGTYPPSPPALIAVSGGVASSNPSIAVTFTVSTIGVSPQSLSFTYTLNSNSFPAPQNLTLSSAAATQCTATSTPTGSWIGPLQNPCVSPGNLTVQLNSAVVAGLAPNTYTGTITITPPAGQGPAAVVSVTLTVLPTPPVTVNPTSLILNYQTGIAAPNPSQAFAITTTTSQQLGFSFVQSGALTNISTITPSSGNTSATTGTALVTYSVNPAGLAVGTYTGKITVFTFGGSPPQQDIGVTLNVSSTALLNVPSATLNFVGQLGSTPAPQTVNITATSGILNYSVTQSANSGWLSVPNAGNTAAPLNVSVNPAGLPAGTYTATVSVLSATPGSTAQQIPVVLKVTNDPTIAVSASTLTFPYQLGQAAPAVQSFRISSSTGVPLNYSATLATTTCGSTWLQGSNANKSLTGVTDDILYVAINTGSLTAGTCTGTITISATNPATGAPVVNSPITIGVTLFVSTTAQLVLTPANLQPFTAAVGAASPAAQSITLSSTNTDVLNYTVAFQGNNGNWLFAGPQNGSTSANANVLTVSVISAGLAAGVYTGTVTVTATGPGGAAVADSPVTIPVTLKVSAGSLTLTATDLTFPDQTPGGPVPAAQTVTIGSNGQPLNYTAVANSNNSVTWLSVTPASGSTSGVITVAVDGSKLSAGTYTGAIVVTSPQAGNSPATITVHFKVNPGTLSAPTTTLTFTQAAGGSVPAAQSIAVTGTPVPLNFAAVTATFNGGANWLSATPASGTTPTSVQVSVSGASLAVGQYTGTITISSVGAAGSPITVPVILNVVPAPVLATSAASLTFAFTVGLAAPAAQNLTVTSTGGSGNTPLTAQAQVDGAFGQWLAVTPTSSTNTPATFTVSVVATGLAAGKYTGRIVVASPIALATITVPVTFTVTAIPQPVVSKVANAASYSSGSVSPGENIVIFGSGIGPATITSAVAVNNVFPSLVGSTRVLFDGTAAPIIYVSSGQTSVMVPYGVAGRTTTTVVVEFSGVQSVPLTYNVTLTAPGIYTLNQQGTGPGAILNQDGLTVNSPSTPEKRGNVIAIYMTGEGQTNPQGVDGAVIPAVASALKKPQQTVTVTIGGVDAPVLYAGSAPTLISGVMQVNVTIPLTVAAGTQPVVVTVGTAPTQSGASAATVVVQ